MKRQRSCPPAPARGVGSIAGSTACAKTACNHEVLKGAASTLDPLIAWNAGRVESHPRLAASVVCVPPRSEGLYEIRLAPAGQQGPAGLLRVASLSIAGL